MKITSARIKKTNSTASPSLLGIASIQLDDCLVLNDLKLIITSKGKRMVSFPNKKTKKYTVTSEGYQEAYEFTDIVHPSNRAFREYIESVLFKMYDGEELNNEEEK